MKFKRKTLKAVLIAVTALVAVSLVVAAQAESVPDQKRLHEHRLTLGDKVSWHSTLDKAYWYAAAKDAVTSAVIDFCPLAEEEDKCFGLKGWGNGSTGKE